MHHPGTTGTMSYGNEVFYVPVLEYLKGVRGMEET